MSSFHNTNTDRCVSSMYVEGSIMRKARTTTDDDDLLFEPEERSRRPRSRTCPATSPSKEELTVCFAATANCWFSLELPDSEEVQKQISRGGPSTTFLDVALGVIKRLQDNPSNDLSEVLFLKDCLKAGSDFIGLPCALVKRRRDRGCSSAESEVVEGFIRSYAGPLLTELSGSIGVPSTPSTGQFDIPSDAGDNSPCGESTTPKCENPFLNRVGSSAIEVGEMMKASFDDWSFDILKLASFTGGKTLQITGWEALERRGYFSEFSLEPAKTRKFLERVEDSYKDEAIAPYHNSLHAADVTQTVHALMVDIGFHPFFERLSSLTLVLGAVIHDMGHNGRTNQFHITMRTDLSIRYNDQSVLENFHVSEAFRLLRSEPEANMLDGLSEEQFRQARRELIRAVLGTDMGMHFKNQASLKSAADRLGAEPEDWWAEAAAQAELHTAILHAADLSHQAKPGDLSLRWAERVKTEFFNQGDEERRLGLPISHLCDRNTVKLASSQVGFIDIIVRPIFVLLALPRPRVDEVVRPEIDRNIEAWESRKETETNTKAS